MAAPKPPNPAPKKPAKQKKRRQTYLQRSARIIRARLLGGLLLVIPVVVTWFIVGFLYDISVGTLVPLFQQLHFADSLPGFVIPAMALLATVAFLYLVGLIAGNYIGKRIIDLGEGILKRIPVVKTVYSASKQVVDTFSLQSNKGFKRVALIEFPRKGIFIIGFVTGELIGPKGDMHYAIFVPTTPNPTSGYLEIVPADQVVLIDMSIEEAIKMIMSGGILAPEQLKLASTNALEPAEADDSEA